LLYYIVNVNRVYIFGGCHSKFHTHCSVNNRYKLYSKFSVTFGNQFRMDSWEVGGSSSIIHDEPFITNIIDDFSEDSDYKELQSD